MADDPAEAGVAVIDVQVALPEDWWVIPLLDAEERDRSVRALLDRQFAGRADLPLLRMELRRELTAQVEGAAAAQGRLLAISLQHVDGVPVPAALVLHWVDLPRPAEPGPGALLLELQDGLRTPVGVQPDAGSSLDLGRLPAGPVLRRVHERVAHLDGAEPVPSLVADYWVERPDGAGVVQLAFSTPVLPLREAMLELFDAIAGALRWVRADRAALAAR